MSGRPIYALMDGVAVKAGTKPERLERKRRAALCARFESPEAFALYESELRAARRARKESRS